MVVTTAADTAEVTEEKGDSEAMARLTEDAATTKQFFEILQLPFLTERN